MSEKQEAEGKIETKASKKSSRGAQAFLKIAKTNKRKYTIIDNSLDTPEPEKFIFSKFMKVLNK